MARYARSDCVGHFSAVRLASPWFAICSSGIYAPSNRLAERYKRQVLASPAESIGPTKRRLVQLESIQLTHQERPPRASPPGRTLELGVRANPSPGNRRSCEEQPASRDHHKYRAQHEG